MARKKQSYSKPLFGWGLFWKDSGKHYTHDHEGVSLLGLWDSKEAALRYSQWHPGKLFARRVVLRATSVQPKN